ncbi:MAG: response regulator [Balneola sp.]|jgi:YesN/AraC family two-component response regulator
MKKVILLEDDHLLSVVQKKMLQTLGYDVIETSVTGEDGLEKIKALQPDFVVSDQNLLGTMKGLDVVEALRKENNETPFLILSGDTTYEHLKMASNMKNVHPLPKPVRVDELKQTLRLFEN